MQHNHDVINPGADVAAQEKHEETDDVVTLIESLMEFQSQQSTAEAQSGEYTYLKQTKGSHIKNYFRREPTHDLKCLLS